ncbi:uncharacterized protein [Clytia hemisphaerica]|uniref:Integrase catalytic domain-containing protein n=2 Tax=Clytia hemisphaerica TaxID=252671 RepID=A0A7M5VFC0_9CNID
MNREKMPSIRDRYTTLSDEETKLIMMEINKDFPNSGIREMIAHLKRLEPPIILQRNRCQKLLAEIDPVGAAQRWAQVIKRRQYSVPSPNSLWHIDSNHALVRWGYVVFGQIDGFSRLVSQLNLSTDNKASSALFTFIKSVQDFGVPSRVRLDKGKEFNHVEHMMEVFNGERRGSCIRGRSVHNQRIERLWRDVYWKVLHKYYVIFYHMEDHNILDILNPIHMFSLQYVFSPRIQNALKNWQFAHNNHPVRTEKNNSPLQLWYQGSLKCYHQNSTAMNNLFRRDINEVNITVEEILDSYNLVEPDDIKVVVPRYVAPLTPTQLSNLHQQINASAQSDGIDIYGNVVRYIEACCSM